MPNENGLVPLAAVNCVAVVRAIKEGSYELQQTKAVCFHYTADFPLFSEINYISLEKKIKGREKKQCY